jgi:hypothetical protein
MDERLNKLLWLIEKLPADQIVIIAEKCKWFGEISPKVQKLISIFDKLSDEEKEQFFRNVTPPCHGVDWPTDWSNEEAAMIPEWSADSSESDE